LSKKVTAINVLVKGIQRKNAKEATAKIKFQLTKQISKAFEWPELPEGTSEWTPDVNELRCHQIELTPNNEELYKHSFALECATIGDFQIQRKAKKEGKNSKKAQKTVINVICTITSGSPTALAQLESFKVNADRNAQMIVTYDPAPVQEEMEGEVKADADAQLRIVEGEKEDGRRKAH
jgi:hypothetical protein